MDVCIINWNNRNNVVILKIQALVQKNQIDLIYGNNQQGSIEFLFILFSLVIILRKKAFIYLNQTGSTLTIYHQFVHYCCNVTQIRAIKREWSQ